MSSDDDLSDAEVESAVTRIDDEPVYLEYPSIASAQVTRECNDMSNHISNPTRLRQYLKKTAQTRAKYGMSTDTIDAVVRQLLDVQSNIGLLDATAKDTFTRRRREENGAGYQDADLGPVLVSSLREKKRALDRQTDRIKYSTDAKYADYVRVVYDELYPDDELAEPNAWFGADGKALSIIQIHEKSVGNEEDDSDGEEEPGDDEIVVAQEKKSYRCPLSQQLLTDPLTSRRCKHSFDRQSILSQFHRPRDTLTCPVPGCNQKLVQSDLVEDPKLARIVARTQRNKDNDEEFEDIE